MAQKTVWLPEIGEVILAKRKGSKSIRLSISAAGKVRVGMPTWVPYAAGINFVKSRSSWVSQHLEANPKTIVRNGSRIGKSYRLDYVYDVNATRAQTRLIGQTLRIINNLPLENPTSQATVVKAAERALKTEAVRLLPPRLAQLAAQHNFKYKNLKIKKLVSRWGSCSSDKVITLNYYLMQLPWDLIDYVLLHELVHTEYLNHSAAFWQKFEAVHSNAKPTRKRLKEYRPVINSID
ncbi:M48 family metallopeptidase [Candidatus Saccharibacteria bacterium]|nr:M48 family metallopeptidase [Candidatus Saccharibacteria bacterium]